MTKTVLLLLAISIAALAGCASVYYPNPLPSPVFNQAGEVQTSVSLVNNQASVQTAYAYTGDSKGSGFAVLFNANSVFRVQAEDIFNLYGNKQNYAEGAWGGFNTKSRNSYFFGGGIGRMENLYSPRDENPYGYNSGDSYLNTNYYKLFAQFTTGSEKQSAFTIRLSYFQSYRIESEKGMYNGNLNGLFLEPALTTRSGNEYFKILYTIGGAIRLPRVQISQYGVKISGHEPPYQYMPFYMGIGFQVNLFVKSFKR